MTTEETTTTPPECTTPEMPTSIALGPIWQRFTCRHCAFWVPIDCKRENGECVGLEELDFGLRDGDVRACNKFRLASETLMLDNHVDLDAARRRICDCVHGFVLCADNAGARVACDVTKKCETVFDTCGSRESCACHRYEAGGDVAKLIEPFADEYRYPLKETLSLLRHYLDDIRSFAEWAVEDLNSVAEHRKTADDAVRGISSFKIKVIEHLLFRSQLLLREAADNVSDEEEAGSGA